MQIYALPKHLPAPEPDYTKFDREKELAKENEHKAQLKAWLLGQGYVGRYTGETARFPFADGSAEYMIGEGKGKMILIHLPYGDGYQYPYVDRLTKKDIIQRVTRDKGVAALFHKYDDWWENQPVGTVVHYCDGFDAFERGVIVESDKGKQMKPTALVGKWTDLPHRRADGSIHESYHVKKVLTGELIRPNASNMYEADPSNRSDPRGLPEIDLTVPPMTAEQEETARLIKLANEIKEMLRAHDYRVALRQVKELLNNEVL